MSTIRFVASKFHSVQEKDGKMFALDMCDCGFCPNNRYDVNEGDTLVSSISVMLGGGHLKNIKIISTGIRTRKDTTVILENVRLERYIKDFDTDRKE